MTSRKLKPPHDGRMTHGPKCLPQVFKLDVLRCEDCGGRLQHPVCAVTEPGSIRRYLRHMNIDYDPPGPPRFTQGVIDFDGEHQSLPK